VPQLAKGGKWVFGWAIVGQQRELRIPPQAWEEYGFQVGEEAILLRGSRTSGGFGVSTPRLLARAKVPLQSRVLARGVIAADGRLVLPPEAGMRPGQRLLVVRGSGRALGFLARGPIYELALEHPELEAFSP